jgi:hypothetical protein
MMARYVARTRRGPVEAIAAFLEKQAAHRAVPRDVDV